MPTDAGLGPSGHPTRVGLWHRLLLRLPRVRASRERLPFRERMEQAFLKPADPAQRTGSHPGTGPRAGTPEPSRRSDDQERLIGLSLAPLAGLIAIAVTAHQLANNPPALLRSGRPNPLHVSVALAHELELVLLALAVAILVTSLLRRRLFTGMASALYGLAVFNLHWWGFGVPFLMVGAWLIVRAYRANQALKAGTAPGVPRGPGSPAPRASKRYTPPNASSRRVPPPWRSRRESSAG